jgi:ATP-dependent DNA ligase
MLSRAADALPAGKGWQFEPKWDGFRTIVFRDGDEVLLQSRDEKPMNRYFPELVAPLAAALSRAVSSTARSSSSARAASTSRRCSCVSIRPPRA